MIHGRIPVPTGVFRRKKKVRPYRDRSYLDRMLSVLAFGVCGCVLLFLIPALYFVEQNYHAFLTLAYDVRPELIGHLEREIVWLRVFFGMGAFATFVACAVFARRLLKDFVQPLESVEDHLRTLSSGDWHSPAPRMPAGHPDRQFFLTYAEFMQSLKDATKTDLHLLESLKIDTHDRVAMENWKKLLSRYRGRLTAPALHIPGLNGSSASPVVAEPLRRVS